MQGDQVEPTIIAALNNIHRRIDDFDVVVIIRGGGATADMSGFDTLLLAENVANFPIPIITGIGHERDESVLDMVSHTRVKTPTAAATLLIDHLSATWNHIVDVQERIISRVQQRMEREHTALTGAPAASLLSFHWSRRGRRHASTGSLPKSRTLWATDWHKTPTIWSR